MDFTTVGLFLLATFAGAVATGLSGFALGLVAAGVWLHILTPAQVAALIVFYGLPMQSYWLWRLRHALVWRRVMPFMLGGLFGVPLSVMLLSNLTPGQVRVGVGTLLVLYSTYGLARPNLKPVRSNFAIDTLIGFLNGLVGGMTGLVGPVITMWCSIHRKHHRYSDQDGDPHSPHLDHEPGWRGALKGLYHAHVGWTVRGGDRASVQRYAKDLLADPVTRFVSRTFFVWVIAGLAFSFGLGVALTGTVAGGLTGLLWGGAVRIFLLQHVTFSINSLCHFFGRRPYATGDESRNLAWLAPLSLGEAWHNNHHAFPTSATHGLGRFQVDISALVIDGLEKVNLVWDVVRVSPERIAAKAV
mgnify:CR=1 FL=1